MTQTVGFALSGPDFISRRGTPWIDLKRWRTDPPLVRLPRVDHI
jgi:hypothetical protein